MGHSIPNSKLQRFITDSKSMVNDPDFPIFKAGVDHGIKEGSSAMMKKALTFLEENYVGPRARPERGSAEGNAVLKLARELAEYLRG